MLKSVTLSDGLEDIGKGAFYDECTSLREIRIHPRVRVFHKFAYLSCLQLTSVVLGEGLKEICDRSFYDTLLREIAIPSRVRVNDSAFSHEVGMTVSTTTQDAGQSNLCQ